MTIVRVLDGKEHIIELTREEIRAVSKNEDESCRSDDILSKIKAKIAEPFEELSWFGMNSDVVEHLVIQEDEMARETAEGMVYDVEHNLGRNDSYWEAFWASVDTVIGEELSGTDYDAEDISVREENGHIKIMVNDRTVADVTEEEINILDFDFFACEENRDVVTDKLSLLEENADNEAA